VSAGTPVNQASPFRDSQRAQLADALKRLRLAAGLTGYQLGEQIGVDQSTVSRIERSRQRISVSQVDLWCTATGATDERRRELLALAENVLVGPRSWGEVAQTGSTNFQAATQELEAKAGTLSFYQPAILPGLLQTTAYARRIFSSGPAGTPPDLAERVLGRMERQRILYDERKQLRFVVPETVLRWPVGPPREHAEQLERLGEIMARPNVDLRIIPMAPTTVWRVSGFVLFDDLDQDEPFVHLELLTGPVNVDDPEQVALYRQVFANLVDAAAGGGEARALLARIIEDARPAS
jgi:transcriptional regulator with XRE-family HTH domain